MSDILIGVFFNLAHDVFHRLSQYYHLGTTVSLRGSLKFLGISLEQDSSLELRISADDEVTLIEPHNVSRLRCKQIDEPLNIIELPAFHSINGHSEFLR